MNRKHFLLVFLRVLLAPVCMVLFMAAFLVVLVPLLAVIGYYEVRAIPYGIGGLFVGVITPSLGQKFWKRGGEIMDEGMETVDRFVDWVEDKVFDRVFRPAEWVLGL